MHDSTYISYISKENDLRTNRDNDTPQRSGENSNIGGSSSHKFFTNKQDLDFTYTHGLKSIGKTNLIQQNSAPIHSVGLENGLTSIRSDEIPRKLEIGSITNRYRKKINRNFGLRVSDNSPEGQCDGFKPEHLSKINLSNFCPSKLSHHSSPDDIAGQLYLYKISEEMERMSKGYINVLKTLHEEYTNQYNQKPYLIELMMPVEQPQAHKILKKHALNKFVTSLFLDKQPEVIYAYGVNKYKQMKKNLTSAVLFYQHNLLIKALNQNQTALLHEIIENSKFKLLEAFLYLDDIRGDIMEVYEDEITNMLSVHSTFDFVKLGCKECAQILILYKNKREKLFNLLTAMEKDFQKMPDINEKKRYKEKLALEQMYFLKSLEMLISKKGIEQCDLAAMIIDELLIMQTKEKNRIKQNNIKALSQNPDDIPFQQSIYSNEDLIETNCRSELENVWTNLNSLVNQLNILIMENVPDEKQIGDEIILQIIPECIKAAYQERVNFIVKSNYHTSNLELEMKKLDILNHDEFVEYDLRKWSARAKDLLHEYRKKLQINDDQPSREISSKKNICNQSQKNNKRDISTESNLHIKPPQNTYDGIIMLTPDIAEKLQVTPEKNDLVEPLLTFNPEIHMKKETQNFIEYQNINANFLENIPKIEENTETSRLNPEKVSSKKIIQTEDDKCNEVTLLKEPPKSLPIKLPPPITNNENIQLKTIVDEPSNQKKSSQKEIKLSIEVSNQETNTIPTKPETRSSAQGTNPLVTRSAGTLIDIQKSENNLKFTNSEENSVPIDIYPSPPYKTHSLESTSFPDLHKDKRRKPSLINTVERLSTLYRSVKSSINHRRNDEGAELCDSEMEAIEKYFLNKIEETLHLKAQLKSKEVQTSTPIIYASSSSFLNLTASCKMNSKSQPNINTLEAKMDHKVNIINPLDGENFRSLFAKRKSASSIRLLEQKEEEELKENLKKLQIARREVLSTMERINKYTM